MNLQLLFKEIAVQVAIIRERMAHKRNPFQLSEIGGNAWPHHYFNFPQEDNSKLPIQDWFEKWQQDVEREAKDAKSNFSDNDPLLRRINAGLPVPAEQLFGNDQGRNSERRTTNLDD